MEHYHRRPPFFIPSQDSSIVLKSAIPNPKSAIPPLPRSIEGMQRSFKPQRQERYLPGELFSSDIGRGVTVSTSRCGRDGAGATPVGQSKSFRSLTELVNRVVCKTISGGCDPHRDLLFHPFRSHSGAALACPRIRCFAKSLRQAVGRRLVNAPAPFSGSGIRRKTKRSAHPGPEPRRRVFHEIDPPRTLNVSSGTDTELSTPGRIGLPAGPPRTLSFHPRQTCHPPFAFPFFHLPLLLNLP